MKRSKRLKKSLESLEEQIRIHEEKLKSTKTDELSEYYKKEIEKFRGELARRGVMLRKRRK